MNRARENYSVHGRNNGCGWGGPYAGTGVSWPYRMKWSPALMDEAREEAERVAAGGAPKGTKETNGFDEDEPLWVHGCASTKYTVTSTGDDPDWWLPKDCGDGGGQNAGLVTSTARMSIFYYDPGAGYPVLTHLGLGLAKSGSLRTWVLVFGP